MLRDELARYIQDSNQGQFSQRSTNLPSQNLTDENEPPVVTGLVDQQVPQGAALTESGSSAPISPPQPTLPDHTKSEPATTLESNDKTESTSAAQKLEKTNRLLSRNEELLRTIRSWSSHVTINEKGESLWMYHLPDISADTSWRLIPSHTIESLIGHLRFYGIGAELIDEETGELKPDKKADAGEILAYYLSCGHPPTR
ncbi:unnamed protein product [Rhizoctonia solani]|uniref:Uncharacterized protein n=1 Tax=Rhizoctonia solani TaxID=456999 RepID=A0A8H3BTC1_9AGAM|nr:unnamed protein product [Rhizoctonia solani]